MAREMDMETKLIRATSDHPDFRSLVAELDADLAGRDGAEHAFYDQYNRIANLSRVVVAYIDGIPVGCGALKEFGPNALEVKRMYTQPDCRGRGIAGQVLRALEQWAAQEGFGRCVLETGRRQPEAIGLYEKHGFVRIPNFGPYAGVANSLCFEKRLEGADQKMDNLYSTNTE